MRRPAVLVATCFGVGYLPIAPATWASAFTAVLLGLIAPHLTLLPFVAITVLLTAGAVLASGPAERVLGHDAHPIVIDEVAGMFVAVCGVPGIGGQPGGTRALALLAAAFALFRFFDIVKPPPVHQAQRLPGGFGIVLDDVLAGVYVNLVLRVALGLWPS